MVQGQYLYLIWTSKQFSRGRIQTYPRSRQTFEAPRPMKPNSSNDCSGYHWPTARLSSKAGRALLAAVILSAIALSWGCAGVVSGQNQTNQPPPPTYAVSGTISPTAGGNGATVTLSGAGSGTTTANSSGAYTFTGLAN